MKVVYIGPFASGEVAEGVRFKRGISCALPDDVAAKLLAEQDSVAPQWVDEGNPLADEAAEQAAALIAQEKESNR